MASKITSVAHGFVTERINEGWVLSPGTRCWVTGRGGLKVRVCVCVARGGGGGGEILATEAWFL